MNNLARRLSTLMVIIFTLVLVSVAFAVDTNMKVGKYQVVINYSPLIACATWTDTSTNLSVYRAVNAVEYLALSKKVFGLSVDESTVELEKIAVTRTLTDVEKVFCKDVATLYSTTLKAVPSSTGTRRTRDITATTYTSTRIPDSSLCEGAIIKKYQKNKNWHKVQNLNLTTLCGEY